MDGYLILEDQSIFKGQFFGSARETSGEVVFNTGMVGYPQSLTDPSYKGQILVFTYPLIGNYGVPWSQKKKGARQNFESNKIQASAVIVACHSTSVRHWSARLSLDSWLKENHIPGLFNIDTRDLTKKLRQKGTLLGKIVLSQPTTELKKFYNPNLDNLVAQVSVNKPIFYRGGSSQVLLIDCGVKNSLLRSLINFKISLLRVPYDYDPFKNKEKFAGVVISNGPGNPQKVDKTIAVVRKILQKEIPVLGICLGNQILALAAGGETYKLRYGHRSQNQPCLLVGTSKAYVTSQNHGYSVRSKSLPAGWREWFINLNDGTNEGLIHCQKPFASVQFHPEAGPGPEDTRFIFEKFFSWLK